VKHFLLYSPAIISIILFAPYGYLSEVQYELLIIDVDLRNFLTANIGPIWIALYASVYSLTAVILLIRWWKKLESTSPIKRYVTYFIISVVICFLLGITTDVFPRVWGFMEMPKIAIVLLVSPAILLFLTLRKFGVLIEKTIRKDFSPSESHSTQEDENRLRLFQTAAAIFTIGAAGSFFTGHFIAKGNFLNELLLSLIVWLFGVFLLFIPRFKKHSVQNLLFLITSVVGMSFFIIKDVNIGASTVWAIYIVFLLYSIILDSKRHTLFFLLVTVATQIILWIIYPEVSTVINSAQYMKRLFIIVLSYFAVQYITKEYASKLRGYQRFSKEQEILEKVSTNFISVDRDNVRTKVDEMFVMTAEILNFDSAYLLELDENYENAKILNVYMADERESAPFERGTTFKTANFPEVKPLISQNAPLLCEDVTTLSVVEAGYQRNFFVERGINSFFALPIVIDKKSKGFFVIEYKNPSDKRFTESRLHFLKILANILGDTIKKILYEERLYEFAYFDKSTKLPNRNMLRKNLDQLLDNRKESDKLVIFNIELENLRMINDSFGQNIGEQVVIKSALILKKLMKEGCTLARVAEDKFIIVMPIAETAEQIEMCANKIADVFANPILPKEGIESLFVTTAIGVASYPDDGKDADTLLQNADLAGYAAKTSDTKLVFCSEQLKSHIEENTFLTNKLFKSMQNKEFDLHFQPQISCCAEKVVGVEALLRWTTDEGRRVPPDVFIPMLEQTGLIHDVGLWVLEQALKEHNRLVAKGFPPLRFSINLSIAQFRKENFVNNILKLIKKHKVDPKYVELEVTESLLSQNFADTIAKLAELKKAGINIAIDDFGKGYSSFHRLQLVPFNRIKIDKSVVDDITFEEKKSVIVKTIISLARALKAAITAEGVETKEQAALIREIGCDEIQGYYYSRPLPREALEEFLKNK
jgi:diguanylate cyclase (GGDEF)-like protein